MAPATAACPEPPVPGVDTIRVMADQNGTRRDLDSQWTFDGEIEGLEAISAGVPRARRWTRIVALLVAVALLLPLLLAVITWVIYNYQGAKSQGVGHYVKGSLFPPGIPKPIYLLVTPIELISTFVLRPITLFIRLLANMIAGHLILGLFFSASTYLFLGFQDGRWWTAFFGIGSFVGAIVFTFFEALVAVLQAYIFTLLTAVYLAGSLEPEH